jgi:hypothetical protein
MNTTKRNLIYSIFAVTAMLALGNSSAYAARYYFSQNLTENGRISGYFDGEQDLGFPDGKLTIASSGSNDYYEVTAFNIHYLGNAFLRKFNCKDCGSQLQEFEYDIASNSLKLLNYGYRNQNNGHWEIDYSSVDGWLATGFFPTGEGLPIGGFHFFHATEPLLVSLTPPANTPLPGALILFLSAIPSLAFFRKKRPVQESYTNF